MEAGAEAEKIPAWIGDFCRSLHLLYYKQMVKFEKIRGVDQMIARTWHGMVPLNMRAGFEAYEYETGVKDTTAVQGNCGAWLKIVEQGDWAHFFLCTKWDSMESMKAYAGEQPEIAVTYPEDEAYGLVSDPIVIIQEVTDGGSPF